MKRLTVLAVVVLGFGAGHGRPSHRCTVVSGIVRVCDAAAAETPQARADRFARALLARWNAVIGGHGFPADVAACIPYGRADSEAVFACVWRVRDRSGHARCRSAVISSSFFEFRAGWIVCTGKFKLRPSAGVA